MSPVDLGGVVRVPERTGCATILVDAHGENCIVVAAGANVRADPASVPDAALTSATILVLQHEVPDHANATLIAPLMLVAWLCAWSRGTAPRSTTPAEPSAAADPGRMQAFRDS